MVVTDGKPELDHDVDDVAPQYIILSLTDTDSSSSFENLSIPSYSSINNLPIDGNHLWQDNLRRKDLLLEEQFCEGKSYSHKCAQRKLGEHHLFTLCDDLIDAPDGNSIECFRSNNATPFAKILTDPQLMQAWQKYSSCSERMQHNFLENYEQQFKWKHNNSVRKGNIPPQRLVDGACAARTKFFISPDLRSSLISQLTSMDDIQALEDELIALFNIDSNAVYVSSNVSAYSTTVIHAICQYYGLKSKRLAEDNSGEKRIIVTNTNLNFAMPEFSLREHLQNMQGNDHI